MFVANRKYVIHVSIKIYSTNLLAVLPTIYFNNRVFLLRDYGIIVAPQKFDVLKTNICPRSEASRENMPVLIRTSNVPEATIRPRVPRHKHYIVFSVHQ